MFIHPSDDYDFVLQLDPAVLPRYLHNVTADADLLAKRGKYANKTQEQDAVLPMPGFDPAKFFSSDLQRVYADTLKIFYDPFGGDKIGAVWDPSLKDARPFRVLGGFSSVPAKKVCIILNAASLRVLKYLTGQRKSKRQGNGRPQSICSHC